MHLRKVPGLPFFFLNLSRLIEIKCAITDRIGYKAKLLRQYSDDSEAPDLGEEFVAKAVMSSWYLKHNELVFDSNGKLGIDFELILDEDNKPIEVPV